MNNKTVLVVGLGGVGKEHVKALLFLGIDIIGVDINNKVILEYTEAFKKGYLVNEWADNVDVFKCKSFPLFTDIGLIDGKYDAVVISTPTKTHKKIYEFFKDKKVPILIEKPVGFIPCSDNIFGGYMYLYDDAIQEYIPKKGQPQSLVMCVNDHYNSKDWRGKDSAIVSDLFSHLLAIYMHRTGEEVLVFNSGVVGKNNFMFEYYSYQYKTNIYFSGLYGQTGANLTINGKVMEVDYSELFKRQMVDLLENKHILSNNLLNKIEQYVKDYASPSI